MVQSRFSFEMPQPILCILSSAVYVPPFKRLATQFVKEHPLQQDDVENTNRRNKFSMIK